MAEKADRSAVHQLFDNDEKEPDMFAGIAPGTTATDLPRWAELGLADPRRDGSLPEDASTADVLAYALTGPGAVDPVEGILAKVARSQRAVADLFADGARCIEVALVLLRRTDGRAPQPKRSEGEEKAGNEVTSDAK